MKGFIVQMKLRVLLPFFSRRTYFYSVSTRSTSAILAPPGGDQELAFNWIKSIQIIIVVALENDFTHEVNDPITPCLRNRRVQLSSNVRSPSRLSTGTCTPATEFRCPV